MLRRIIYRSIVAFFVCLWILRPCTGMYNRIDDVENLEFPVIPAVQISEFPVIPDVTQQKYSRRQLYSLRAQGSNKSYLARLRSLGLLRYRGCRGGHSARQRKIARVNNSQFVRQWARDQRDDNRIEVIQSNPRPGDYLILNNNNIKVQPTSLRPRQLLFIDISRANPAPAPSKPASRFTPPSIYLLNATSIAKPNAIQQLQADVISNAIDVTIISETWLKPHHDDSAMSIPGYSIFRRDRRKRKGGGLAIYVKHGINARVHNQPGITINDAIELLWVALEINGRSCYVGAVYHPPKPIYSIDDFQTALESSLEEIFMHHGDSLVILAGDFHQLPEQLITSMGLVIEFNQPTHEGNCLDKIFASEHVYINCKAFTSTVKTKHKAIIARSDCEPIIHAKKQSYQHSFRPQNPALHAAFLLHLQHSVDWSDVLECSETQLAFDMFYELILKLFNDFYPLKTITTTNRDPDFITPEIKSLLRKKINSSGTIKSKPLTPLLNKSIPKSKSGTQQASPNRARTQKNFGSGLTK